MNHYLPSEPVRSVSTRLTRCSSTMTIPCSYHGCLFASLPSGVKAHMRVILLEMESWSMQENRGREAVQETRLGHVIGTRTVKGLHASATKTIYRIRRSLFHTVWPDEHRQQRKQSALPASLHITIMCLILAVSVGQSALSIQHSALGASSASARYRCNT